MKRPAPRTACTHGEDAPLRGNQLGRDDSQDVEFALSTSGPSDPEEHSARFR